MTEKYPIFRFEGQDGKNTKADKNGVNCHAEFISASQKRDFKKGRFLFCNLKRSLSISWRIRILKLPYPSWTFLIEVIIILPDFIFLIISFQRPHFIPEPI